MAGHLKTYSCYRLPPLTLSCCNKQLLHITNLRERKPPKPGRQALMFLRSYRKRPWCELWSRSNLLQSPPAGTCQEINFKVQTPHFGVNEPVQHILRLSWAIMYLGVFLFSYTYTKKVQGSWMLTDCWLRPTESSLTETSGYQRMQSWLTSHHVFLYVVLISIFK